MAILSAILVAGCGSDTIAGLEDGFDAGVAATIVEAAATAEWANLATGHAGMMVLAIKNTRPVEVSSVPTVDDDRFAGVGSRSAPSLGPRLSRVASTPAFSTTGRNGSLPDEALGKTYRIGEGAGAAGGYRIDEERTGAPADGARFVMYVLNEITGRPQLIPISRAGQVDLTEPVPNAGLRLYATDKSDDVLADLQVERVVVEDATGRATTLTSSGTLVKSNVYDYTLRDHVAFSNDLANVEFEFERDVRSDARDLHVAMDSYGQISYTETGATGTVTLSMLIESGGHSVGIDIVDDGVFANGSVTYDGQTVVLISGDNVDPTFQHPDGTLLEGHALDEMWELWFSYDYMLAFGDELILPLSTLML